jgi:hypothetical protein
MTRLRLKRVALASVTRQGTVTIVQVDLSQCADVTRAAALTPLKGGADHEIKRSVNKRLRALYVFCVQAPVFI